MLKQDQCDIHLLDEEKNNLNALLEDDSIRKSRTMNDPGDEDTPKVKTFSKKISSVKNDDRLIEIINKKEKDEREINLILKYVQKLAFFRNFKNDIMRQCSCDEEANNAMKFILKEMSIETFPANSIIQRENDISNNKAYVLLEGKIGIWKENKKSAFENDFLEYQIKNSSKSKFQDVNESFSKDGGSYKDKKHILNNNHNRREANVFDQNTESPSLFKKSRMNIVIENSTDINANTIKENQNLQNNKSLKFGTTYNHLAPQTSGTPNKIIEDNVICSNEDILLPNHARNISSKFNENILPSKFKSTQEFGSQHESSFGEKNSPASKNRKSYRSKIEDDQMAINCEAFGDFLFEKKRGEIFGEIALTENKPRGATVISTTSSVHLIIKKEQFDFIGRINLAAKQNKSEFIMKILPSLTQINGVVHVSEMLAFQQVETYSKNSYITRQGEEGQKLYFVKDGNVKVFHKADSGKNMLVSEISEGTMIGEECLFNESGDYKYTTQASSLETRIFSLAKKYCQNKLPFDTLLEISLQFMSKDKSRLSTIENLGDKTKVYELINSTKPDFYVKQNLMNYKIRKDIADKKNSLFKTKKSVVNIDSNIIKKSVEKDDSNKIKKSVEKDENKTNLTVQNCLSFLGKAMFQKNINLTNQSKVEKSPRIIEKDKETSRNQTFNEPEKKFPTKTSLLKNKSDKEKHQNNVSARTIRKEPINLMKRDITYNNYLQNLNFANRLILNEEKSQQKEQSPDIKYTLDINQNEDHFGYEKNVKRKSKSQNFHIHNTSKTSTIQRKSINIDFNSVILKRANKIREYNRSFHSIRMIDNKPQAVYGMEVDQSKTPRSNFFQEIPSKNLTQDDKICDSNYKNYMPKCFVTSNQNRRQSLANSLKRNSVNNFKHQDKPFMTQRSITNTDNSLYMNNAYLSPKSFKSDNFSVDSKFEDKFKKLIDTKPKFNNDQVPRSMLRKSINGKQDFIKLDITGSDTERLKSIFFNGTETKNLDKTCFGKKFNKSVNFKDMSNLTTEVDPCTRKFNINNSNLITEKDKLSTIKPNKSVHINQHELDQTPKNNSISSKESFIGNLKNTTTKNSGTKNNFNFTEKKSYNIFDSDPLQATAASKDFPIVKSSKNAFNYRTHRNLAKVNQEDKQKMKSKDQFLKSKIDFKISSNNHSGLIKIKNTPDKIASLEKKNVLSSEISKKKLQEKSIDFQK